jgi:hypothetical protein
MESKDGYDNTPYQFWTANLDSPNDSCIQEQWKLIVTFLIWIQSEYLVQPTKPLDHAIARVLWLL